MFTAMHNKQLARRVFEEYWNKHNSDFTPDMYTSDFTLNDPFVPVAGHGLTAAKSYFETFNKALPDLHFTIEDQIAEGDMVVTRLYATGTHEGELLGIPATHAKATVPVVVFHRFEDGKIANAFVLWDAFTFFRAIGVIAPAGMAKPAYTAR